MKNQDKLVWGLAGLLTLAGGAAHLAPAQMSSIVSFALGPLTVQMLAGVACVLVGLTTLGKAVGK